MKFKVLHERPKGVQLNRASVHERRQFILEFQGLVAEFIETGVDWAELDGWSTMYASAQAAQTAMNWLLRDTEQAFVHRAGERLYLRHVHHEENEK